MHRWLLYLSSIYLYIYLSSNILQSVTCFMKHKLHIKVNITQVFIAISCLNKIINVSFPVQILSDDGDIQGHVQQLYCLSLVSL